MSLSSVLSITTVTRPLSAGSMTVFSSVYSRLSAFCSSGVKLLFGNEADCKVEVTLLLMLSDVILYNSNNNNNNNNNNDNNSNNNNNDDDDDNNNDNDNDNNVRL